MRAILVTAGIILALVIGFTAGRYALPGSSSDAIRADVAGKSGPRARPEKIVARGRLEPEGGVVNIGTTMGDRLNRVVVKEGQRVKKGDELAYLESHPDRLAEFNLAQAQLSEAQVGYDQVKTIEPLDIEAQDARVHLLDEQLKTARRELGRLEAVKVSVPKQQMEMQALAVQKAESELSVARALLNKLTAGHKLSERTARAKVEAAQAGVDAAKTRLTHAVLRAPSDGTILKIIAHAGETLGSQPILQMGDTNHMTAQAEVYETDVQYLREGDPVKVTSPALPEPVSGKVVSIGRMVARNRLYDLDPTAAADQRVVTVKVALDESKAAERFVNLQVTVRITPSDDK